MLHKPSPLNALNAMIFIKPKPALRNHPEEPCTMCLMVSSTCFCKSLVPYSLGGRAVCGM